MKFVIIFELFLIIANYLVIPQYNIYFVKYCNRVYVIAYYNKLLEYLHTLKYIITNYYTASRVIIISNNTELNTTPKFIGHCLINH